MMRFAYFPVFLIIISTIYLNACQSTARKGETEISSDVVQNPNSASARINRTSLPVITFETMDHDFGRILDGESVSFEFKFTNTGKSDLLLAEVTSSCGCTIPSYSKAPIRPGEKGSVRVTFNSQGKRGYQTKSILVVSNTQPNTTVLRIKAQVVNPSSDK